MAIDPGLKRVIPVEFIEHPSIGPPVVVNLIEGQDDEEEEITVPPPSEQSDYGCDTPWLQAIRDYIIDGQLPAEKWAARKIDPSYHIEYRHPWPSSTLHRGIDHT